MAYKVVWTFADGSTESQTFDDEIEARLEAHQRSTKYAQLYGRCETEICHGDHLIASLTETYYG